MPDYPLRDCYIPARVFYLLQKGLLTRTDVVISVVVDAMVHSQGVDNDTGCCMSNVELAEVVYKHPIYISQRINKLRSRGLLLLIVLDGRRYLEMEWSRTAEERESLAGEYGKLLRAEHRMIPARLKKLKKTQP